MLQAAKQILSSCLFLLTLKVQKLNDMADAQNGKTSLHGTEYVVEGFRIAAITQAFFLEHCSELSATEPGSLGDIAPQELSLDQGFFTARSSTGQFDLSLLQTIQALRLSCSCEAPKRKLCTHQAQLLQAVRNRKELRIFFDEALRHAEIKKVAAAYGLEGVQELDDYFELFYLPNRSFEIRPRHKGLVPVNQLDDSFVEEQLLKRNRFSSPASPHDSGSKENFTRLVVLGQHRFYHHLYIELLEAPTSREGKIKNPSHLLLPRS